MQRSDDRQNNAERHKLKYYWTLSRTTMSPRPPPHPPRLWQTRRALCRPVSPPWRARPRQQRPLHERRPGAPRRHRCAFPALSPQTTCAHHGPAARTTSGQQDRLAQAAPRVHHAQVPGTHSCVGRTCPPSHPSLTHIHRRIICSPSHGRPAQAGARLRSSPVSPSPPDHNPY